jgi:hypothetical protein
VAVGQRLTAVLQIVSQEGYDDTYRPRVEWANVNYKFTPDFSVRIGRTASATFLVSDSRLVGYANPWVRPPVELYAQNSVTANDGIDLSYRLPVGPATNTFQASAGRANYQFPILGGAATEDVRARQQLGMYDTLEWGFTTVHASFGTAHISIPLFTPLFDGFRQFGPQGEGIADRYDVYDRIIGYVGFGAQYDPGRWFVMSEWGRVNAHSVLGEKTSWYLSAGYRIAKLTPYATYADLRANSNTSDPGLSLAGLAPALAAAAAGLNANLNAVLGQISIQRTLSTGVRWDLLSHADLKVQYDHTWIGAGSGGTLIDVQPGFRTGGSLDLISVTLDFVW